MPEPFPTGFRCSACDYDLSRSPVLRCSECGHLVNHAEIKRHRRCINELTHRRVASARTSVFLAQHRGAVAAITVFFGLGFFVLHPDSGLGATSTVGVAFLFGGSACAGLLMRRMVARRWSHESPRSV